MDAEHDRLSALQTLAVSLVWLEHLAVRLCERYEAVPGQLEDEKRHRELFAKMVGWDDWSQCLEWDAPLPPVQELIEFTEGLEGEAGCLVLNLVAECWLETILTHLGSLPDPEGAIFREVAADEMRHSDVTPPRCDNAAVYVRELERHLHAIASDPSFMWPLTFLLGHARTVELAKALHGNHEDICRDLNVAPGDSYSSLLACRREAENQPEAVPVELDKWRRSAFNLNLGPMVGFRTIRWDWEEDPLLIEARFVRAAHRVLSWRPHLALTINPARKELHNPLAPVVGVRRPGVVTAYSRPCEDLDTLARDIRVKARQARASAVEFPEVNNALLRLRPPSHVPVVVTSLQGASGMDAGLAPLSPVEGAIWSIGVPGRIVDGAITVGIYADHRAVDGLELCDFINHLVWNLGVPDGSD